MSPNSWPEAFQTHNEFSQRHIGPTQEQIQSMLSSLGFSSLEDLSHQVIPKNIRSQSSFSKLGAGLSEFETLKKLKLMMCENQVFKSYLGQGYYDTLTPTVIQRNILENPVWYTAYTPYQPEISQGRLESLLNFQTMVCDLTAMEIANSSLLDEGTAAAEAMSMAANLAKNKSSTFFVDENLHPHAIEVLKTRSEPIGLKMLIGDPLEFDFSEKIFSMVLAYPHSTGAVVDYSQVASKTQSQQGLVLVSADLLALTLLKPPGEWGADIVFGTTQRFGVPLGFGGPHAAYLSTKDAHKRLLPGRLVGVSIDAQGNRALRLTLQTREQHIRREKATSNICTAQVLLANMAAMYGVYHGPKGLKTIAERIHCAANTFAKTLTANGFKTSANFFDTVLVEVPSAQKLIEVAEIAKINLRKISATSLSVSFDETTSPEDLLKLVQVFAPSCSQISWNLTSSLPNSTIRTSSYLTHPVFNSHHSETELLRYIHELQNKDLTLTHSMIPLGSCTMKLNATTELVPVSWPEVNRIHPFAPLSQAKGYLKMIAELESQLCEVTGFDRVSLQPNAGSQGEYAGLLVIRKYLQSKNQSHRNIVLIPSSAHGTNPASAIMAGLNVVVVQCDEAGNVDVSDLKAKALQHKDSLAALMVTYPSTHGVFEESIVEICKVIHEAGGQVYMDGANLNALVGVCRPGEFGPDVCHMNLHKTFSIPHGGGGPGIGPIGVASHLSPFLPTHSQTPEAGPSTGVSAVSSAPWGSASILPISWAYITMMGTANLRKATLVSILNANYIAKKLQDHFPVLYKGREGLVAHECILDLRDLKKQSQVDVMDVAKRLMDYGFHAPTMSWPVAGTLMVEPTESESQPEMDRFINAMISIRNEIRKVETGAWPQDNNPLKNSPHSARLTVGTEWSFPYSREVAAYPMPHLVQNKFWPPVGRIDNAYGDRNIVCSCPPLEDYGKS